MFPHVEIINVNPTTPMPIFLYVGTRETGKFTEV